MLRLRERVVNDRLKSGIQDHRAQQNNNQTDVHDRDFVLLIGNMPAKQRSHDKRDHLSQPDQPQCQRIVRHFIQFITDNHLLNKDRCGKKKGIGDKKPKIRVA